MDVVANDKYVEISKHSNIYLMFSFCADFKDGYKASKIAASIDSGMAIISEVLSIFS